MASSEDPLLSEIKKIKTLISIIRDFDLKTEDQAVLDEYCSLLEALNIMENQYDMIFEIYNIEDSQQNQLQSIKQKYKDLGVFTIPIFHKKDLCVPMITHCIKVSYGFLQNLNEILKSHQHPQQQEVDYALEFEIFKRKLQRITHFIPLSAVFDPEDLIVLDKSDKRWQQLQQVVKIKRLEDPVILRASYLRGIKKIRAIFALCREIKEGESLASLGNIVSLMKLFSKNSKADKLADAYLISPNERIVEVFNLAEKGVMKNLTSLTLPNINFCKKIYISRKYPEINKKIVDSALQRDVWSFANRDFFENIVFDQKEDSKFNDLLNNNHERIPVRLLCTAALGFPNPNIDGVIVHIHGGAFIGMSSFSHQNYTRKWANWTNKVIFSIDYRLAPDNPYPCALDDCWQVYNWIVDNCESILGICPKKIILAGDSAGGNLAMALANLLIRCNRRIPDGIFLSYPSFNISSKYCSPSYINSIQDPITTESLIQMARRLYTDNRTAENDPLASPALAPQFVLKYLPPIRICTGEFDYNLDECYRFVERSNNLHKNVFLTVYEGLYHGYLTFDTPKGIPEIAECVKDGAEFIKELFSLNVYN